MNKWYFRTSAGEYFPVEFHLEDPDKWHNKIVTVKIGNSKRRPDENDLDEIVEALQDSDVIMNIENASFFITPFDVEFAEEGISQGRMFIIYDDKEEK